MKISKVLLAFGLVALLTTVPLVRAQDDTDGNGDAIEDDGGRTGTVENDGNDGDDTSLGANPPNALIGCLSPYTYLSSQEGLSLTKGLIDAAGVEELLKYRNASGVLFAPTNLALRDFAASTGLNVNEPEELNGPLIRSIIQYHILFDTVDPTTLASLQTPTSYDTTLALNADGSNANLQVPATSLLTRDATANYANVTLATAALPAGSTAETAPNGTYTVTAGSSRANIVWDATNEPVRTCVGYIYKVDGVLLPSSTTAALSTGALAPTESEGAEGADSNDGSAAVAPNQDDDGAASSTESEGSEGTNSNDGTAAVAPGQDDDGTTSADSD